ncbi:flagellin [Natronobacillus azotifigens]|uniref:Flagellin n=1 Tax=Natronobacillus azotifigens TaxID=472978 RepID=A0A9J6R968_9BACI|nr:flagellin [Natronobacillus azotifigens]MCZ0702095.1 flagellin [Natronobacillus azotifigens]
MRINHNIGAMFTYRFLVNNYANAQLSLERLSSGLRINRAADDAAGLAISEKMRAQISGLRMAERNAQDGISLLQTAEGALNETHAILQRMRELSVQAANGTYSENDRLAIQQEITLLTDELTQNGNRTEFNKKSLLDGSFTNQRLQIGANAGQSLAITIGDMRAEALGIMEDGAPLDLLTQEGANEAIQRFDAAISKVSTERSKLGATQNRLYHTINNLSTSSENLVAAESRIRDVDMAKEIMNFTKHNILGQASQMMLAQAMNQHQGILQLLG